MASDDDYYHIPDTPDERKLKDVSNALAKKLPNSNCSSPSKSSSSGGIKKKPDNLQSSEFEQIKAQVLEHNRSFLKKTLNKILTKISAREFGAKSSGFNR